MLRSCAGLTKMIKSLKGAEKLTIECNLDIDKYWQTSKLKPQHVRADVARSPLIAPKLAAAPSKTSSIQMMQNHSTGAYRRYKARMHQREISAYETQVDTKCLKGWGKASDIPVSSLPEYALICFARAFATWSHRHVAVVLLQAALPQLLMQLTGAKLEPNTAKTEHNVQIRSAIHFDFALSKTWGETNANGPVAERVACRSAASTSATLSQRTIYFSISPTTVSPTECEIPKA